MFARQCSLSKKLLFSYIEKRDRKKKIFKLRIERLLGWIWLWSSTHMYEMVFQVVYRIAIHTGGGFESIRFNEMVVHRMQNTEFIILFPLTKP